MEEAELIRHNKMDSIHKTTLQYQIEYTQNCHSRFGPLPQISDSDENSVDQHYGLDPYWEDTLYDQDNLEYRHNYNKPQE